MDRHSLQSPLLKMELCSEEEIKLKQMIPLLIQLCINAPGIYVWIENNATADTYDRWTVES
jgi:hypothetical protein